MGVGAIRGREKKCELGRVHRNHCDTFALLDGKKNAKDFVLIWWLCNAVCLATCEYVFVTCAS